MRQKHPYINNHVLSSRNDCYLDQTDEPNGTEIFIGGLEPTVREGEIFEGFSKFGKILQIRMMLYRDGRSRGFAFLSFELASSVKAALACQAKSRLRIKGKQIEVKPALTPEKSRETCSGDLERKLYVGNLSSVTTDESLEQAFERFGEIVSARVVTNIRIHSSRGFGFVLFKNKEDVKKVVGLSNPVVVDGMQADCKPALSKPKFNEIYDSKCSEITCAQEKDAKGVPPSNSSRAEDAALELQRHPRAEGHTHHDQKRAVRRSEQWAQSRLERSDNLHPHFTRSTATDDSPLSIHPPEQYYRLNLGCYKPSYIMRAPKKRDSLESSCFKHGDRTCRSLLQPIEESVAKDSTMTKVRWQCNESKLKAHIRVGGEGYDRGHCCCDSRLQLARPYPPSSQKRTQSFASSAPNTPPHDCQRYSLPIEPKWAFASNE